MACATTNALGGKDLLLKFGNGFCGAEAVTFQNTGDTVTRTAHGLLDGQVVRFATVVTTTTVVTGTTYYVISATANTFQVSLTAGGSAVVVDADGTGTMEEAFQSLGGMREPSLSIEAEEIEITNVDSSQWKQLLDQAGIKSASLSGSGVFFDEVATTVVRNYMLAGKIVNWRLYTTGASGDYYNGLFKLTSFEHSGPYNDAQSFSISLASSGALTFTAV